MTESSAYARNITKLCLIRLLFWMHFFAAVLVPFYTEWGTLTLGQVFWLNAWFFSCTFVFEVPTGTVADYLGRKVSLVSGCVIGALGVLLYASRPGFAAFMLAEAVMAVAYTLHSGADDALAYDSLKALGRQGEATRVAGRMEALKLTGIVLATILGGFIATRFGLRAPMRFTCIPLALAGLLAVTLKEPPTGAPAAAARRSYAAILRDGARFFVSHPRVRRLALEAALTNAMAWGIVWLFQPLLGRAGVPLAAFGIVHAFGCLAQIAVLSHVSALATWVGSLRRLLRLFALLAGASLLLLAVSSDWRLVVPGVVAAMGFGLSRAPLFTGSINHHLASSERATVLSFCGMTRQMAIVIANLLVGALADRSLFAVLLLMGGALVAAGVFTRVTAADLDLGASSTPSESPA